MIYEVTVQLASGSLDVEVEFEPFEDPTDAQVLQRARTEIESQLELSKLDSYRPAQGVGV